VYREVALYAEGADLRLGGGTVFAVNGIWNGIRP
jgi:hypothetical protein